MNGERGRERERDTNLQRSRRYCEMLFSPTHIFSVKAAPKKVSKTYSYSSSVVTSPLDYGTVDEWLDGLKMGQYKVNFTQQGISTTNEVLALDEDHLKKMGITLKGHVSKIVRSIAIGNQKLGREPSIRI